ncbi:hypothetical protein [Inhella proteolytica]|uniref:Hemerythrin-like domain-containing protein n=1 Tax=Inhella proteolytica TaxID=2795029 RepID=A0A931NJJ5_9BURK|nr:hypothetical protein [Inhella proteolytica]MBH9578705.1 hypothetical protein [Inhella proteolytica]
MKRHPLLIPLAREHHASLVFAHWCQTTDAAISGPTQTDAHKRLRDFRAHFEAHAATEERNLTNWAMAPELQPAWKRMQADHRAIRRALEDPLGAIELQALGELVEAHTRWEDLVFSPALESSLKASTSAPLKALTPLSAQDHSDEHPHAASSA